VVKRQACLGLIAPEHSVEAALPANTPEKRALAVANGLRKLRRAVYHARAAVASTSPAVSWELMRIGDSVQRNGLDVQMADPHRAVGAAVAIEAETGEPVARRLAEAVARFEGVFAPQKPRRSALQFVQQMQFRRRLRSMLSEMRDKRGPAGSGR
jgi:hypothetical protein